MTAPPVANPAAARSSAVATPPASARLVVDGLALTGLSASVDLSLIGGQWGAIVGPIGAGKSLLLEAVAGIVRPGVGLEGHVLSTAAGDATTEWTSADVRSTRVSLVPQDSRLSALGTDRVARLLGSAWERSGDRAGSRWTSLRRQLQRTRAERTEEEDLLERLGLSPRRLLALEFRELSHGEQQRVLLAQALLEKNPILAYDGLGEGLDGADRRRVASVLNDVLAQGRILLATGRRLSNLDLPSGSVVTLGERPRTSALPLVRRSDEPIEEAHAQPLLEVERLRVGRGRGRFGGWGRAAFPVDGASLYLRHGECLVLLGASGSGKTTLLEAIAGVVRPSSGRVRLLGATIIDARRAAERRFHNIQLVFQDASQVLDGSLTVREHLTRALALRGSPKLWGPAPTLPPPEEWMDRVGLPRGLLNAPADWLSAGEAQRVDLARSLVLDPDVILFDAPRVGGVDDDAGELMSLMLAQKERGKSFVMATSDPATARLLADRIAVLHAGRVIEFGPAAELLDAPAHPATRALLSGSLGASDPRHPLRGCPHVAACPHRELPRCDEHEPALGLLPGRPSSAQGRHRVACYHPLSDAQSD